MSGLRDFQETFQRAVTEGDDAVLTDILDSPLENRRVLLGVYRNAYVTRLRDILGNDYPKLALLLGDDQFADLAVAYIAAHPSRTPNARWFGTHLPDFLKADPVYRGQPVLAELAALERTLNDAFDAADADPLAMTDLAAVPAEQWGGLTFAPRPAARRLDLFTNADEIWTALDEEREPPAVHEQAERQAMIVYRTDTAVRFRCMAAEEAMMWDEAANGVDFALLCEMLATFGGAETAAARAAGYLQRWIDAGMLKHLSR